MVRADIPLTAAAEAAPEFSRSGPMSDRTPTTARKGALASVAAIAIVASGALGATVYEARTPALAQTTAQIATTATAPASFADVVEKVKPAVVAVRVKVENAVSDDDGMQSF